MTASLSSSILPSVRSGTRLGVALAGALVLVGSLTPGVSGQPPEGVLTQPPEGVLTQQVLETKQTVENSRAVFQQQPVRQDQPVPLAPGVTEIQVELTGQWILPSDLEGEAGLRSGGPGASIPLANEPEMLILDTNGRQAVFALRSLNDGLWSDWVNLETDTEDSPDGLAGEEGSAESRLASAIGPIWIGDGAQAVEIIERGGDLVSLRIESLKSQDQPAIQILTQSNEGAPSGSQVGPDPASAVALQPVIQPRSSWTSAGWAYENEGCSEGPNYADNVQGVVIHHTVTTNSYRQDQVGDILRGIYRTHVTINGWCDIGYNFLVDKFGTIWEARSGGTDRPVIGGHTKGFNTSSTGVAVLGQYQRGAQPAAAAPTAASLNAIAALASWKLGLHGVDPLGTSWMKSRTGATSGLRYPNGTWVEVPSILGHRDLGLTVCPGSYLYARVSGVRNATIRDAVIPYVFPAYKPAPSGPAFLTLDQSGGIRAGGAAAYPRAAPSAAANVIAIDAIDGRGFTLDQTGTIRSFGQGPSASSVVGGVNPVDLVVIGDGTSGYVVSDGGEIQPFGGAPGLARGEPPKAPVVAADLTPEGIGYVLSIDGTLSPLGGAPEQQLASPVQAVDVGVRSDGQSGWILDSGGRLHPFGGAPASQRRGGMWNGMARAIAVDPNGNGGWVLDSEGRLDVFGDERAASPLSTTVGSTTAVDVALWWELSPALAERDLAQYVNELMSLFLGRDGSLLELDRLGWEVDFRGSSALVEGLANSDEWAGRIVAENYQEVLRRPPDDDGRAYWVGRLRDGMRTQDLGVTFYSSPEYVRSAGSDEAYVRRLYLALLQREPDASGLSHWVELLSSGRAKPVDIAAGFYRSIESRNGRVRGLYQIVLGRAPDSEGLDYWSGQLVDGDDIDLAMNLALSAEFYQLATGTVGH